MEQVRIVSEASPEDDVSTVESSEVLQRELECLLSSPEFSRAPGASRLLQFLVEKTVAGESQELKETVIGHVLYRRQANYDTKVDSVVRVNANRLRVRLDEFYTAHPDRRTRISLRKGSYIPVLRIVAEIASEQLSTASLPAQTNPGLLPAPHGKEPLGKNGWHIWLLAGLLVSLIPMVGLTLRGSSKVVGTSQYWSSRPFSHLGGSQTFPDLSPDGKVLAFAWNSSSTSRTWIYLQNVSTGAVSRLSRSNEDESRPVWSRDGSRIAFLRFHADGVAKDIVIHQVSSGQERVLTTLHGGDTWLCNEPRLAWNREGTQLITSAPAQDGDVCGLVELNTQSGATHWLTPPGQEGQGDLEATISPNGEQVAFARLLHNGKSDIFLMNLQSASLKRLTHEEQETEGLHWSRDGQDLIVGSRRGDGLLRLWLYDTSGHVVSQITDGSSVAAFPSLTGTDKGVLFTRYANTGSILSVDKGKVTALVSDQSGDSNPQKSPDGRYFLYSTDRTGTTQIRGSDWTHKESWAITPAGATVGKHATWSPDGTRIAYECKEEHTNICIIASNGYGKSLQMTNSDGGSNLPSWSHDGKWIYYSSDRNGSWQIYRKEIGGSQEQQITHKGGKRALESLDGKYLFVHRGESANGLLRINLSGPNAFTEDGPVILPELTSEDWNGWDVGPGGIYFLTRASDGSSTEIDRLDPESMVRAKVAILNGVPPSSVHYLSAGSGGARLLVDQSHESSEVDIAEAHPGLH